MSTSYRKNLILLLITAAIAGKPGTLIAINKRKSIVISYTEVDLPGIRQRRTAEITTRPIIYSGD